MTDSEIKAACEAVLFASGESVSAKRLAQALEIDESKAESALAALAAEYESDGHGIAVLKLNDSYLMCNKKQYGEAVRRVMDIKKNTPLSQAALEVLAVVAYNQPVTKAFVEQVRGVDCSGVIGSLTTKNLIEEKGRLELPGRPLLYGTTENFLKCFQLSSLDDLPVLPKEQGEENEKAEKDGESNGEEEQIGESTNE